MWILTAADEEKFQLNLVSKSSTAINITNFIIFALQSEL
jgi:hypothetical protein